MMTFLVHLASILPLLVKSIGPQPRNNKFSYANSIIPMKHTLEFFFVRFGIKLELWESTLEKMGKLIFVFEKLISKFDLRVKY